MSISKINVNGVEHSLIAFQATQDAGGNVITTTYETKTDAISKYVTASSTDGVTYTATVANLDSLTVGASFIIIPNKQSTSATPTLNVNGLGAKNLKRRLSSLATSVQSGYNTNWLQANYPFRVFYDGTQWIVEGHNKPVAADLYGTLAINKGGTGATDAATALTNLGAQAIIPGAPTAFVISTSTTELPDVVEGAILVAYDA